jgi:hypothetical protein
MSNNWASITKESLTESTLGYLVKLSQIVGEGTLIIETFGQPRFVFLAKITHVQLEKIDSHRLRLRFAYSAFLARFLG